MIISENALRLRVSRKIAKDGESLHRSRQGSRAELEFGDYYITDARRLLIASHCDLEQLGREVGALGECERMEAA